VISVEGGNTEGYYSRGEKKRSFLYYARIPDQRGNRIEITGEDRMGGKSGSFKYRRGGESSRRDFPMFSDDRDPWPREKWRQKNFASLGVRRAVHPFESAF